MRYRYYLPHRPATPGTIPRKDLIEVHNFEEKQFVEEAGRDVWAYADYSQELEPKVVWDYDLIAGGAVND